MKNLLLTVMVLGLLVGCSVHKPLHNWDSKEIGKQYTATIGQYLLVKYVDGLGHQPKREVFEYLGTEKDIVRIGYRQEFYNFKGDFRLQGRWLIVGSSVKEFATPVNSDGTVTIQIYNTQIKIYEITEQQIRYEISKGYEK
jgi:hypothetical protein